ncbi:MAG: glycosyltransferase family 1 protein [Oscillospiraceae bacterium]|nr:glycosyltransferase family 1 protein [Oscillospiraceae bacterium]
MSEIIRVLHVIGSMNVGGAETFIMNVYRNIDREKVQFDFLLNVPNKTAYEDEITSLGGKIYRIPRRFPNYLKHLKALDYFFKKNTQYNIVHQHTGSNVAISTIISAKKHNINKIIYHSHNSESSRKDILSYAFEFIYKSQVKKYANYYFACSYLAAEHLFGKYIDKKEIKIINNAIDTEKFIFNKNIRELKRKELQIDSKFVIGHTGRFATQKNHTFILDIFAKVCKHKSDAVLLLIGDGSLRGEVENKIERLGLKDKVILTGVRSDVNELLQAMDIFLFPSLWEGFGIVLIEAQASGLHSIASADVVPESAKVTDLLEYIPLEESPVYWAKKVLQYENGYERKNMQEKIIKAGFDIKETTKWLQEFYCGK